MEQKKKICQRRKWGW